MRLEINQPHNIVFLREAVDEFLFVLPDSAFQKIRNAGAENTGGAGEV